VQALSKWVFRPAQLNNQPVAVKVLLGNPSVGKYLSEVTLEGRRQTR
jgi:hypothetical protein